MSISYYLQAAFSLLIILGVMAAFLKWGKWVNKQKYTSEMKVVDRLSLDPSVTLFIVEIRNQSFVAAVGGKDLKILRKI